MTGATLSAPLRRPCARRTGREDGAHGASDCPTSARTRAPRCDLLCALRSGGCGTGSGRAGRAARRRAAQPVRTFDSRSPSVTRLAPRASRPHCTRAQLPGRGRPAARRDARARGAGGVTLAQRETPARVIRVVRASQGLEGCPNVQTLEREHPESYIQHTRDRRDRQPRLAEREQEKPRACYRAHRTILPSI